jgi:hypothetical protein
MRNVNRPWAATSVKEATIGALIFRPAAFFMPGSGFVV